VKQEQFLGNTDESDHATVTITTAQVLALAGTPIEIVPAPGAGKAVVVDHALFFLDYNSIAYNGVAAGEDLSLRYTDENGTQIMQLETTGFIDQTNDELRYVYPNTDLTDGAVVLIPTANAAVVVNMLTGDILTGNSPLIIRAYYRIIPTTLP
jgi:hypothetical protein